MRGWTLRGVKTVLEAHRKGPERKGEDAGGPPLLGMAGWGDLGRSPELFAPPNSDSTELFAPPNSDSTDSKTTSRSGLCSYWSSQIARKE